MKNHTRYFKHRRMHLAAAFLFLLAAAFVILPARKTSAAALPADKGIYRISSAIDSKYVLDITDGSRKMKANVQLMSWKKKTRQKFIFEAQPDGTFLIRNVRSKHVLTAADKNKGQRQKRSQL